MIYAQFYSMSTGYVDGTIPPQFDDAHKKPIEACGDRSIVIIDARLSKENIGAIAAKTCKERGYCGYRIFKGDSILNGKPISGYWPVATKVDNSATSASMDY